jgi:ankyrin repeat protein
MLATQRKHIEMIKVLIEAGAEVDTMQKDLWSPIMHAASREDEELVHILLEAGSVDMDDALCESFRLENINISGKLMDAGAQIDSI